MHISDIKENDEIKEEKNDQKSWSTGCKHLKIMVFHHIYCFNKKLCFE